jgi:hypothetical protein
MLINTPKNRSIFIVMALTTGETFLIDGMFMTQILPPEGTPQAKAWANIPMNERQCFEHQDENFYYQEYTHHELIGFINMIIPNVEHIKHKLHIAADMYERHNVLLKHWNKQKNRNRKENRIKRKNRHDKKGKKHFCVKHKTKIQRVVGTMRLYM